MEFVPEMEGRLDQHSKSISVIHYMKRLKKKNHVILTTDTVKEFEKIQHPFMIKLSEN